VRYGEFVSAQIAETDLLQDIPHLFQSAGKLLQSQNYSEACSIETIALEVASTNERPRLEAADVFKS
jgi:hypothetical protein